MVNETNVNDVLVSRTASGFSCIKYKMQKACTQNAGTSHFSPYSIPGQTVPLTELESYYRLFHWLKLIKK